MLLKCLAVVALAIAAGAVEAAPRRPIIDCLKPAATNIRIFDALAHAGKPDLRSLGMMPVHVIDRDFWADMKARRGVDPARVRQVVAALPRDKAPLVLDIEHFNLLSDTKATAKESRELISIIREFKKAAPDRLIGFYGFFPIAGYAREIEADDKTVLALWRKQNDAMHLLEAEVDMLFPALYTDLNDPVSWTKRARTTICEARRLSRKPVYPFIWPEFHEGSVFKNSPVPAAFWGMQLDTLSRHADGFVIWDGWDFAKNRLKTWDGTMPWWRVTNDRIDLLRQKGRLRRQ
jgi:Hyaluronidase